MSANEPLHDPADLLDELDAMIREQESLRQRAIALQARYRALEAHADQFDKPGPNPWLPEEFGSVNVEAAVQRLDCAADSMYYPAKWFVSAREYAAKVREYPQPERVQADRPEVDRGRSL
ncbi:hypothetical protein IU501_18515 [Nocardia otitidiscaviarum]|uniref:hypothetical protein n=1 Tax=Nocardia otitidiscaviarum TaxID=1823 RepID=UPI0018948169|nr:hypothetical protein [Nocardia otitidiscaviarum]MBF6134990.1 hypothetical protein [Nocardia otitidiscaviarum]